MNTTIEARRLLRAQPYGVLSTLSKKLNGYPFGSLTPYILDARARPVILISTLAEHTKNMDADSRVSLLAHTANENVQASGRVTVVGNCTPIDDAAAIRARYLRYFPDAAVYFDTHDFFFYRIEPAHIRFIGGFGAIHWINSAEFAVQDHPLPAQEDAIIAHMNTDHSHNLQAYCRHFHDLQPASVEMLGIDIDGFDLLADSQRLRIDFSEPVRDAQEARRALVAMAQVCRA